MSRGKHLVRHFGRAYWATVIYAGWTKNQMGITKPLLHKGRKP